MEPDLRMGTGKAEPESAVAVGQALIALDRLAGEVAPLVPLLVREALHQPSLDRPQASIVAMSKRSPAWFDIALAVGAMSVPAVTTVVFWAIKNAEDAGQLVWSALNYSALSDLEWQRYYELIGEFEKHGRQRLESRAGRRGSSLPSDEMAQYSLPRVYEFQLPSEGIDGALGPSPYESVQAQADLVGFRISRDARKVAEVFTEVESLRWGDELWQPPR